MPFNSYSYLLLCFAAVAVFWALPARLRRGYVILLSFLFYASWHLHAMFLPALVCAGTYLTMRLILARPERGRTWARCGIGFILVVLAFFKYRQFFLENVGVLISFFGGREATAVAAVSLPLGISFYSFGAIGALIDTRQKRVTKMSFADLYVFLAFWPSVISGPIVRVRELSPQLKGSAAPRPLAGLGKPFDSKLFVHGTDRLIWGLVQKNVVANSLAVWVNEGFAPRSAALNSSIDTWSLAVAYSAQIYFDFAAYTNMALGSALLLGVKLPENFKFPYHAENPADFWARWHMSLSRWVRDYLFFPINGRFRGAPLPLYASLIGIMVLVGLWHGAGWGFVCWGLMHGCYLVLHRMWESATARRPPGPVTARLTGAGLRAATLIAVIAAWVPFRAVTLEQAKTMLGSMFFGFQSGFSYSINFYIVTAMVVVFCLLEPALMSRLSAVDKRLEGSRAARIMNLVLVRPLLYAFGLLLFMVFDDRDSQFIYFQF